MTTGDLPIDPSDAAADDGGSGSSGVGGALSGSTAWARNLEAPLRDFLRTETGSAAVLLFGAVAALVWANVGTSYETVWQTVGTVAIGGGGIAQDLRHWVNDGLMALFFFVVGLEARREFDLGDLRDRRRLLLPLLAGTGGMVVPVALFLLIAHRHTGGGGWGVAMSTDTAFALGMLALVGRRFPASLRAFMLTVAVVDDLVALVVIAVAFTSSLQVVPLCVALGAFALFLALRARGVQNGGPYLVLGLVAWVGVLKSGVDPIVVGLAAGLRVAVSPNERLQQLFHPFASYVVVPLFALANAGFAINGSFLEHAYGSSLTLGILVAYVVGKPLGICLTSYLVTRCSGGKVRPPVGWASVLGGGSIAGIGFTVSLLIATLAFRGGQLAEAKLGVLSTLVVAPAATFGVQAVAKRLPRRMRLQLLIGSAEQIVDLAVPVDPERDHIRGPVDSDVTLLEYGDLECPFCGRAEPVIRELLSDFTELRYVWRHLPLNDVHPHAQLAAEAAEAAATQGRFWEMHDLMIDHQGALTVRDILAYARDLGLDEEKFTLHMKKRKGAGHIADDVESADLSGVSGTPSFFVNGHRHQGAYDIDTLSKAVRLARARGKLRA